MAAKTAAQGPPTIATVTASSVIAVCPVKSSAPMATVAATVVATPSASVVAAVAAHHTTPVVDAELQPQAKRPKGFTLSEQAFDATLLTSDPAMQSRMESLLKEVCLLAQALAALVGWHGHSRMRDARPSCSQACILAKRDIAIHGASTPGESMQLERLISANREMTSEIAQLNQAAAQREAAVAHLQVQLMQARMDVQQAQVAQQQAQAAKQLAAQVTQQERDKLIAQHQIALQQVR